MSQLNKLYRNFIILQEDERGYSTENDKTLSGYSKIEAKGEKCKISFYAQNLRSDSDDYYGLVIFNKKDTKRLVNLGNIAITEGGKIEVTKEYFRNDIGGLGLSYDKISGAAIVKLRGDALIVIMCGFINGEEPNNEWKDFNLEDVSLQRKVLERKPLEKKALEKVIEKKEDLTREDKNIAKDKNNKKPNEDRVQVKNGDNPFDNESSNNPFDNEASDNPFVTEENNIINNEQEELQRNKNNGKFDSYEKEIEKAKTFYVRGSVGEYFESIASGLEVVNNEYRDIKYCKWYNVPVNDLNEMCNMSNYNRYTVAYYPMLNYYPYIRKYGNFRMGYKCDREGNLKYIVYGIPGRNVLDEQPYEGKTGFVTWVKDENREGVGCWLMFYDFRNSTVVVPME